MIELRAIGSLFALAAALFCLYHARRAEGEARNACNIAALWWMALVLLLR